MKILIVRFSSIGDIILTTPVIRCLAEQRNAEIHYITKTSFAPLLESNPHIHRLYTIDKHIDEVIDVLKNEEFALMIDLHHNLRTQILRRKLRIPTSAFHKINIEKWLKVNLKLDILPKKHVVDRYLETAGKLKVRNDGKGLDYFIPDEDLKSIRDVLDQHQILNHVCVSVGAAHQTKCLTESQLIELCDQLDAPIILLGGKAEIEKSKRIEENTKSNLFNAVGKFSLNETAAAIALSSVIISHDTGTMHIGAALKKPLVSIWGNTIPAFGMTPYYGNNEVWNKIFETKGLSCRPCSKIGYSTCPKSHFKCIQMISVKEIAQTVNEKTNSVLIS